MDHRWTQGPIEHDQLEQIARPIWADGQVASWILINRLHHDGIAQSVLDVLGVDSVAKRRPKNVHVGIVLRNFASGR